jgi:hypothetical protein
MNERLQNLAEQARSWAETAFKHQHEKFTSHWDNPVGYTVTQFFEQKFAELIVKECAKIAGKAEYSDTWLEPVEDAIKKHFGVEE